MFGVSRRNLDLLGENYKVLRRKDFTDVNVNIDVANE